MKRMSLLREAPEKELHRPFLQQGVKYDQSISQSWKHVHRGYHRIENNSCRIDTSKQD